jgi:ribosomal-protein-alanine N-acetyltransferase
MHSTPSAVLANSVELRDDALHPSAPRLECPMINGTKVTLRPLRESELDDLHPQLIDIDARGPWFPMPRTSLTRLHEGFSKHGFWSEEDGVMAAVDPEGRIIGMVNWELLNSDVPDVEIGYRVFDASDWGKGFGTEMLDLLSGWLFDTYRMNRLRLTIHVDNIGSQRVAENCGFERESTAREGWYSKGHWHDVHVYILRRVESDARRNGRNV